MGEFKDNFKKLREMKHLSQEEVAKGLGVAKSTISMYERGERLPSHDRLEDIADYFNIDMDYLVGRDPGSMYYLDPETARIAQEILENHDLRMLFDMAADAPPEAVKAMVELFRNMRAKEYYDCLTSE